MLLQSLLSCKHQKQRFLFEFSSNSQLLYYHHSFFAKRHIFFFLSWYGERNRGNEVVGDSEGGNEPKNISFNLSISIMSSPESNENANRKESRQIQIMNMHTCGVWMTKKNVLENNKKNKEELYNVKIQIWYACDVPSGGYDLIRIKTGIYMYTNMMAKSHE